MATPNESLISEPTGETVNRLSFKQWAILHPEWDLEQYEGRQYYEWLETYVEALTAYVEDSLR